MLSFPAGSVFPYRPHTERLCFCYSHPLVAGPCWVFVALLKIRYCHSPGSGLAEGHISEQREGERLGLRQKKTDMGRSSR